MNAIIFRLFIINGALFDVLDYYLYAKYSGKDTKLVLIRTSGYLTSKELYNQIERRYKNLPDNWKKDIIWLKGTWSLVRYKFENVIVMDYFTTNILNLVRADHFHLVYDHDEQYIEYYEKFIEEDNFTIYNEMPFGIGNIEYKLKIPMEIYNIPPIGDCDRKCYINCTGKGINTINEALNITKKDIVVSVFNKEPKVKELNNIERVELITEPPLGFFKMWNTYIYIHDGVYFEPRCRLLLESRMMNKKIIYKNENEIKDGSYYRWKEMLNKKKLPKNRILTKDDLLMKTL